MTATVAEWADLRSLSDDELAGAWNAGDVDLGALEAECSRRDHADAARQRAAARARADHAEWYDAAFAQYLNAEAECRGHMLSRFGEAEGIESAMVLWTGSEAWARKRASEELRGYWDGHGGRASRAQWLAQKAMAGRLARDERDLAAMVTAPAPRAWETVPGGRVRETTARVAGLPRQAWWALGGQGNASLHPSREAAAAALAPRAAVPPMAPGAIARYTAALSAFSDHVDSLTARMLATRGRITGTETTR